MCRRAVGMEDGRWRRSGAPVIGHREYSAEDGYSSAERTPAIRLRRCSGLRQTFSVNAKASGGRSPRTGSATCPCGQDRAGPPPTHRADGLRLQSVYARQPAADCLEGQRGDHQPRPAAEAG